MTDVNHTASARKQLAAVRALWLETIGFFATILFIAVLGFLKGLSAQYLLFAFVFIGIYAIVLGSAYVRLFRRSDLVPRSLEDAALRSLRARERNRH